jgi:microcystin-dependent protein
MNYTNRTIKNEVMLNTRYSHFVNQIVSGNSLYLEKNVTFNGTLLVTGDITSYGNLTVGNLTVNNNLSVGGDISANTYYARGNYYLDGYVLIPAGTIIQSAAINRPNGWLDCDGSSLSASAYADLFNAIGYAFGGSSGTFLLPDMRGRTGVGIGTGSGLSTRNLGSTGGEETHTLTVGEMPAHTHTGTTNIAGNHTHTSNANGGQGGYGLAYANGQNTETGTDYSTGELNLWTTPYALTIDSAGNHSHGFTTNSTGDNNAHNNMQPFLVLRYLIKY